MAKKEFSISVYWILVAIVVGYLLINYTQKFAITEEDFVLDGSVTLLPAYAITGTTIANFSWTGAGGAGVNYTMENQTAFYMVGNSTTIYSSLPSPEGTNVIYKYKIGINDDGITATLTKWHTVYTKEIKTQTVTPQQICVGVGGTYSGSTCTCPDKTTKWDDNSTSKVCPPITVITEKEVYIGPTFFERYGIALIILVVAIVIIFIMRRKK